MVALCFRPAVVLGVAVLLVTPSSSAQELSERVLEYQEARSLHEAAILAWEAQAQRYERELARADALRESGSDEELDAAHRAFYSEAVELRNLDLRVRGTRQRLEETRSRLLDALDRRREELEAELEEASTARERSEARALLIDLNNRYEQIEEEVDRQEESRLVLYSALELRPLDGAFELRTKARLARRRAGEAETQLAEWNREIERLRSRLRIQRNRRDFEAGLSRFDDTRPPVGPPGNRAETREGLPTDSTALATPGTLSERIEQLVELRDQLLRFRDQLMEKAETFEERLRRITT